jgi:hypothetical protein
MRERHDHVLRLDQVFGRRLEWSLVDLGAARVAVLLADLDELARITCDQALRIGEDVGTDRESSVSSSWYSLTILSCSRPVSRCRRMSRIAWACVFDSR